jgi:hypothetical protein
MKHQYKLYIRSHIFWCFKSIILLEGQKHAMRSEHRLCRPVRKYEPYLLA